MDGLDYEFIRLIDHQNRFRLRLKTRPNERPTFAVILECQFQEDGRWVQVIRCDDWDGGPHLDIVYPSGRIQKQWLPDMGDNKDNLREALAWMLENWESQRGRYEAQIKQS